MTHLTNFPDNATHGENIELSFYNSQIDAQQEYDYFKEHYQVKFVHPNNWACTIGDSSKPMFTKSRLRKMFKAKLEELAAELDIYCNDSYTKGDYVEELSQVTIEQYYKMQFACGGFHNREFIEHPYYITRGYCQGDAIIVIDVGNHTWGTPIDINSEAEQRAIHHYFWDTPAYVHLEINGNDCYLHELLNDRYEYDREQVIQGLNDFNLSPYAEKWVTEHLPMQIDDYQ